MSWHQLYKYNQKTFLKQHLYLPSQECWIDCTKYTLHEINFDNKKCCINQIHLMSAFKNLTVFTTFVKKYFVKQFFCFSNLDFENFFFALCDPLLSIEKTIDKLTNILCTQCQVPCLFVKFEDSKFAIISDWHTSWPNVPHQSDCSVACFIVVTIEQKRYWYWASSYGEGNTVSCLCCGIVFQDFFEFVTHVKIVDNFITREVEQGKLCLLCPYNSGARLTIDHLENIHSHAFNQREEAYEFLRKRDQMEMEENMQAMVNPFYPDEPSMFENKEDDVQGMYYEGKKFQKERNKVFSTGNNSGVIIIVGGFDLEASGLKDSDSFTEKKRMEYLRKKINVTAIDENEDNNFKMRIGEKINHEPDPDSFLAKEAMDSTIGSKYFNPAHVDENGFLITTSSVAFGFIQKGKDLNTDWMLNFFLSDDDKNQYTKYFPKLAKIRFQENDFFVFDNPEDPFMKHLLIDGVFNLSVDSVNSLHKMYQAAHENIVCVKTAMFFLSLFSPLETKDDYTPTHCLQLYIGAHNGAGFDFFFLLRALYIIIDHTCIFPFFFNGRIQKITVKPRQCWRQNRRHQCLCKIFFIDSINYCNGSLASIAKTFKIGIIPDVGKFEFNYMDYHRLYLNGGLNKENPFRVFTLENPQSLFGQLYTSWCQTYAEQLYVVAEPYGPVEDFTTDLQTMCLFYNRNDTYLVIRILEIFGNRFQFVFNKIKNKIEAKKEFNEKNTIRHIVCFNYMHKNTLASLAYLFLGLMSNGHPLFVPKKEAGVIIGATMVGGRSDCFVQGTVLYNEAINYGGDGINQMDICGMYGTCQLSSFFADGKPQIADLEVLTYINSVFCEWEAKPLTERDNLTPHHFSCGIFFGCFELYWPREGPEQLTYVGITGSKIEVKYKQFNHRTQQYQDISTANICWNNLQKKQYIDLVTAVLHCRAGWIVRAVSQNNQTGFHFPSGCKPILRDFISLCFEIKDEGVATDNVVMRAVGKNLANSTYGKMSQKAMNIMTELVSPAQHQKLMTKHLNKRIKIMSTQTQMNESYGANVLLVKYQNMIPEYCTPIQHGSIILACARTMFYQFILPCDIAIGIVEPHMRKPPLTYSDTDSAYVDNGFLATVQKPELFITTCKGYKKPAQICDNPPTINVEFEIKEPNGKGYNAIYLGKKANVTLDQNFQIITTTLKGANLKQVTPTLLWSALTFFKQTNLPQTSRVSFKKNLNCLDISTDNLTRAVSKRPVIYEDVAHIWPQRLPNDPLSCVRIIKNIVPDKERLLPPIADIIEPAKYYTALIRLEHLSRGKECYPTKILIFNAVPLDYKEQKIYKCSCSCEPRIKVVIKFFPCDSLPANLPQTHIPESALSCHRYMDLCRDHNCRAMSRDNYERAFAFF